MLYATHTKRMTDDNRLVECLVIKWKEQKRAAICLKVGLGKNPVKLLQDEDYHSLVSDRDFLEKYLNMNVWRPKKRVKFISKDTVVSGLYQADSSKLKAIADGFNNKAAAALKFVTGETPGKPIQNALNKKNAKKIQAAAAEKKTFYGADSGNGMF